jgi:ribosomal protein S18 acetylase RimI-like enzyme
MQEARQSGEAGPARQLGAPRVRRAGVADCGALVSFNLAMARETEGRGLDEARVRAGTAAVLAGEERGFYLVAEDDAGVLGALLVTREWSDWRNGWFWWIQSVYVLPRARRQGVYRALYADVLERARASGADERVCGIRLYVDEHNRAAQAVYAALGMQRAHYQMFEVDFVLQGRA